VWIKFAAASAALFLTASTSAAMQRPAAVAMLNKVAAERDGRHDFDFYFGSWKVAHRRLRHPLSGSTEWYEFESTLVMRGILGFANMDENVLDTPTGRVSAVGVRLYNKKTNEWSIYYGSDVQGAFPWPPTVGKFDERGVGRFYDHETYNGKPIVVRFTWSHSAPNTSHWDQAFSPDDGKTWETNWVQVLTRTQ
jgi:hypothetical protein